MQGLKLEVQALCAYFTLHNPMMLHTIFNCCWMDVSNSEAIAQRASQSASIAVSLPTATCGQGFKRLTFEIAELPCQGLQS